MRNRALRTLYIYNGIFTLGAALLGPLYAIFVQRFEADVFDISVTWAAFLVSASFFTFLISKVGDRIPEKEYLLLGGFLVRAIGWFFFIFVGNLAFLIFLQVLLGVGEALGSPAFDAIFAEHLDSGRHIIEYSDWKLIANMATATGVIVGGAIVEIFGFPWLFASMSLLAMVAFLGVFLKPRPLL
ncbi:MAG: MFS transporter [Candidatus Colwellbacteria bacterium]|nr:MFS transporter [Candidatus Colwellbacteria bacterium]